MNSESSLFISPHRLILKTCGTTLNLLGLPRILEIAANYANLCSVHRIFYSRKSFMFPERQLGPHKDWNQEIEYLDQFFKNGAAYTVGKVNGDHWLLYMASAEDTTAGHPVSPDVQASEHNDYTIEILMSDLSPKASQSFSSTGASDDKPSFQGLNLSQKLGITDIFPPSLTKLDAYSFDPCGYSSNALIKWSVDSDVQGKPNEKDAAQPIHLGEGYYTIHVTPEEGWSYASFECNVPLSASSEALRPDDIPDLKSLIKRLVNIFEPGRITLTLFVSREDGDPTRENESPIEAAQRAFKAALTTAAEDSGINRVYKRTDKINYEFDSYDLAFASFEVT